MIADAPEVPFASWLDPVSAVTVSYSLPVFHEIDFQVNEGYRRIPHGGVEVGGLLYGRINPGSARIEAFRAIACEHASGPSFHLSERDLANLSDSIQGGPKDEELQGLVPLGWFISHTRSALRLTDKELQLFDRFFPEPMRLTVLVKPERFKPTRFAFLLRDPAGQVNPDGERSAVILPLPGRPGKSTVQAMPAPSTPRSLQPATNSLDVLAATEHGGAVTGPEKEKTIGELPVEESPQLSSGEARTASLSTAPVIASDPFPEPVQAARPRSTNDLRKPRTRSRAGRLLVVLGIAALLGCGAGYWAYLQLPPPIISLRAQKRANDLLVLWNPAQTQASRYAVIRVNDAGPVLLSEEQKASGIAQVPLSGDNIKVEIVAPHWARDSRGIIRFLTARPSR